MSKSRTRPRQAQTPPLPPEQRLAEAAEGVVDPSGNVRVDAPHEFREAASAEQRSAAHQPSEIPPAAAPGADSEPPDAYTAAAQRLRTQAAQLAAHLDARQKQLDHRESELNARTAEFDRDLRTARLWLAEREADLSRRDEELALKEKDAVQRSARMAAAENALEGRAQVAATTDNREEDLQRRETTLRREQQQIDVRREASLQLARQLLAGVERRRQAVERNAQEIERRAATPGPQMLAREESLRHKAESLDARARDLALAEAQLAEALAEAQRLSDDLRRVRSQIQQDAVAERERLAAERHRALDELEKQRRAVERRAESVDRSHAALRQFRGELERTHREALEIRLAIEELWAQLSGAAPPALLSRSLSRIRGELADRYRQAAAELHAQREELEGLRREMTGQRAKAAEHKQQVERWASLRLKEADQHAARLIAREEQLSARETELREQAQRWRLERLALQQEIRRLRALVPSE